jgi:hypothetical protein
LPTDRRARRLRRRLKRAASANPLLSSPSIRRKRWVSPGKARRLYGLAAAISTATSRRSYFARRLLRPSGQGALARRPLVAGAAASISYRRRRETGAVARVDAREHQLERAAPARDGAAAHVSTGGDDYHHVLLRPEAVAPQGERARVGEPKRWLDRRLAAACAGAGGRKRRGRQDQEAQGGSSPHAGSLRPTPPGHRRQPPRTSYSAGPPPTAAPASRSPVPYASANEIRFDGSRWQYPVAQGLPS